ncbi:MAG TPA: ATP-binding protein [Ktedonobacterales bacterium]|jgi:signal transduction histidine kinase/GAF domain-containing protein
MAPDLTIPVKPVLHEVHVGNPNLEEILDRLVQNAGMLLEVTSCSVALQDPATGDLVTWSALNVGPDGPRHTRFRPGEGVAGWVALHMRPLIIDDATAEPRFKQLGGNPIGSLLCVPLMEDNVLLGTLTATSPQVGAFDTRRQQLLQVFADQAVLAITKARQAEEARKQAAELQLLLNIAGALTSSLEPARFFEHIAAGIRQVARCDDAVIYAFDQETRVLRVVAGLGLRAERLSNAEIKVDDPRSLAARVARENRPRVIEPGPTSTGEVTEAFLAGDRLAMLCVPLVSKNTVRGVITVARPSSFTQDELRVMRNLVNIVAAALENVALYQTTRMEREQQAAIFAAGSDGFAIVDASLAIVEANEAFARLVGRPLAQVYGLRACAALGLDGHSGDVCDADCKVAQALETGIPLPHLECEVLAPAAPASKWTAPPVTSRRRDSSPAAPSPDMRYVDMSVTPVSGAQGRRALLIARDVTALRHMDQLKASVLSMIAHELRGPLQTINGYLDATLDQELSGALSDQHRHMLRRARAGGEQLKGLVDDVLLISRRDAGQFRLLLEPLRLEPIIANAHEEMELLAVGKGVAFTAEHQPCLPVVEADETRLQQVLRNLLSNALKFTPAGGDVRLTATYDDQWVRLSVSDTGIGIAPEHVERIFDRYYQVEGTNGRSHGQGLGLAIVRIIVEGHGGRIEVRSQPGKGSTFTVFLPIAPADTEEPSAPAS